jgi:methylated-DNA-[protein]-cysteine S-methyltransferase
VRDGVLVQHELASEALRVELERGGEAVAGEIISAVPDAPEPGSEAGGSGPANGAASSSASPNGRARRPARTLPADSSRDCAGFVAELCRRVGAHLSGLPTSYLDVPLALDWATPLQLELVAAARRIPWGEVVSYGELAALAGRPGAARAAGSFCADNRLSLIIPCHRVVAANGIGGYGSAGPQLKRRLLALEGVQL